MSVLNKIVLVTVVAMLVLVLVSAAHPAEDGPESLSLLQLSSVQKAPAMTVRGAAARQCTNSACAQICAWLGWPNGVCIDAESCLCYQ